MGRTIVTFLNKQPPLHPKKKYAHGERVFEGSYFPEALMQFCEFDRLLVFLTAEARESAWPTFAAMRDERIVPVNIPIGRTAQELWRIFHTVVDAIPSKDEVVIDITHALRSIPFLVFLFVAYLQFSRRATLGAIYYGAADLVRGGEPAPVIDLTDFANMLQWIGAAEQFTTSGNGEPIARLLRAQADAASGPTAAADALREAAASIDHVSRALALNLPLEASHAAWHLQEHLPDLLARGASLSPQMRVLGDAVRREYAGLSLPSTDLSDRRMLVASVWQQRSMVFIQLRRGALFQAALLLHETLVSAVMVYLGNDHITEYEQRERVGSALQIFRRMRAAAAKGAPYVPSERARRDLEDPEVAQWIQKLTELPHCDQLARNFGKATFLRNSLAHCGFEDEGLHSESSLARQRSNELHHMAKVFGSLLRTLLPWS